MFALPDLFLWQFALAFLVTAFAGFTKGITGFAMPMIMVSGMASFLDPELAIASIVLPTFVSNLWQSLRQGWRAMLTSFRSAWLLISTTLIFIYIFAQVLSGLKLQVLMLLLGAVIFTASFVQIMGLRIHIAPRFEKIGAVITGVIAGFFGSIAGTWGPPTIIYLLAIGTEKKNQVRITGISFGLGALVFWLAHQRSGFVTPEALGLSAILLLPMAVGLFFGAKMQDRIDQATFRKATLWVLLIAALNIIRRALMG